VLPAAVRPRIVSQLEEVRRVHEADLAAGRGRVFLPDALARKFPGADREFHWQYVFPSGKLSIDPRLARPSDYFNRLVCVWCRQTSRAPPSATGRPDPASWLVCFGNT